MSTLMQTYERGAPLCFHFADMPDSARVVAAMIETPEGLAVANDSVFDPYATKRTSPHPGEVRGIGPWTVGAFTFSVVDKQARPSRLGRRSRPPRKAKATTARGWSRC